MLNPALQASPQNFVWQPTNQQYGAEEYALSKDFARKRERERERGGGVREKEGEKMKV